MLFLKTKYKDTLSEQLKRGITKLILSSYFFINLFPSAIYGHEAFQAHSLTSNENLNIVLEEIRELEQKNLIDGKVLIARGDQVLFVAQNKEFNAMGEESQFMIGSISKQFFAAALLKLLYENCPDWEEEKKIEYVKNQLAQPLSSILPAESMIWNGHMPEWAQTITLHHLLSHTSGLEDYTGSDEYQEVSEEGKRFIEIPHAKSDVIGLIAKKPLLFAPGTQFVYSCTGYVLIAEIIEVLSELPAHVYLQQTLFTPLGLTSTFNPDQGGAEVLKKISHLSRLASQGLYDLKDRELNLYPLSYNEDVSNAIGSGSIISTAVDLLKWNLALHKVRSILPDELYQLMVTPNLEGYGYGIGLATSNHGMVYMHRGVIDAYRSRLYYFPEQDLSIIVLTSTTYDEGALDDDRDEILLSLSNSLSHSEKEDKVMEQLLEKYPDERGFNCIIDLIDSHLEVELIK